MNLLTLKEISSPATPLSTLTKWAREGKLTGAFKIGKKWVITDEDFESFIKKEREANNSPLSTTVQQSAKKVGQDEF